jgi:putative transcriptional regulator
MSASLIDDLSTSGSLTGQLLIASPAMRRESFFAKSIIYILSHNNKGAIGIMINHVANNVNCSFILNAFNVKNYSPSIEEMPVHFGGPIESEKGFILHSCDYNKDTLLTLNNQVAVSSNIEILKDIALGFGPKDCIFALGYAGWDTGQLEAEIASNIWLTAPFSDDVVFNKNNAQKWQIAIKKLGIDPLRFSTDVGHA